VRFFEKENTMARKLIVGITQGDGNGIGYEVIIKALADERILELCTPVIYGSSKIFGFYKKHIHDIENINTNVISTAKDVHQKRVNIVNCLPENVFVEPGQATPESAKSAMTSLERAVEDLKEGHIDVLVTAPINKRAMSNEGFGYTGHTEYLEQQFGVDEVAMIMVCDQLKIAVVTGHIPLKDVCTSLTKEKILKKLRLVKASLQQDFGIDEPKIAVLGLNPHCGDGGLLGDEEPQIIIPAVQEANAEGIMAFGPYSPDGFFGLGNYSKFDAVLAMYHDQGLTPFKAIAFEEGVNYTAGLPVVRTSPDHGTAYEMAGRDKADPRSMKSAIYTAIDIWHKRQEYNDLMENRMTIKLPDTEIKPRGGKIIE
jgi:4-hydroxythreonine-4-phosphate dehydrogenase